MDDTLQDAQSLPRKRIYIVEDHPTFREGLVQILGDEPSFAVCGQAGTADEALPEIDHFKPDLVLVDISLPGKSGLSLIKELRAAQCPAKLLVISMHDEALYADRVLRAGADGYIMKEEDPEEIMQAVRDVLEGRIYVSDQVLARGSRADEEAGQKSRSLDLLADRELEILELLGQGKTESEIAPRVGLSNRVLNAELRAIRRKLGFASEEALVRYAVRWIETCSV